MDNRCVKCGAKIGEGVGNKKRLWCSVCLDEIYGKINPATFSIRR